VKILYLSLTILFCFFEPAVADDRNSLHTFSDVEKYLIQNPTSSMDEVIAQLSTELRSNYQLVYASRSTMKGSLAEPRVILTNSNQSRTIAFGGNPSTTGGMQMEFMEMNPTTRKLEFKMVEFGNASSKIHSNPTTCIACHASQGIAEKKILRPIWDTYPDWPGVYGSSHNNIYMNREGVGTSRIQDLEFEKNGFEAFKKNAASNARYRHLIGLDHKKLQQLAESGTRFSDRLIGLNNESVSSYVREALEEIRKNPSVEYRLHKAEEIELIMNQYWTSSDKTTFTPQEITRLKAKFDADLQRLTERQSAYYQTKLKRLKKVILDHSSLDADLTVADQLHLMKGDPRVNRDAISGMQTFSLKKNPVEDYTLQTERLLESLDLDRGATSIAFEPFSSVSVPGNQANLSKDLRYWSFSNLGDDVDRYLEYRPLVTKAERAAFQPRDSGCNLNAIQFLKRLFVR
jgi:hypothetical protein